MNYQLSAEGLDLLFRKARTHNGWQNKPVSDDLLRQLYDVLKWGPTSANCCPARFVFLRSEAVKAAMSKLFADNPPLVEATARRNSSLQGAYMMLAARALGLDCGPMSGFDNARLDEEFFGAGKECKDCEQEFFPEGQLKSNFLCNLGYGDPAQLHPRGPRLEFDEACKLL
jgi:3-hydroxypropanoate dehydrogenase